MANKDLFKQAIAEAKSVREAAIANAKQSLEESLTPHLKDMLAAKLQELEGSEEVIAEAVKPLGELQTNGAAVVNCELLNPLVPFVPQLELTLTL